MICTKKIFTVCSQLHKMSNFCGRKFGNIYTILQEKVLKKKQEATESNVEEDTCQKVDDIKEKQQTKLETAEPQPSDNITLATDQVTELFFLIFIQCLLVMWWSQFFFLHFSKHRLQLTI